jgi:hypothetical protein
MRVLITSLFVVLVVAGCATTNVTDRQIFVTGPLPRPGCIFVHNFAVKSADVPMDSSLAGQYSDNAVQTEAEQEIESQLSASIADHLVEDINEMGLYAEKGSAASTPQINDIVIRGYLLSVVQGNEEERMVIGLGDGASELKTAVEGYQMTAGGLRKLGSGTIDSSGSKSPGAALGIASTIATANPAGLLISGGMKVYGEESGSATIEGRAAQTAREIADVVKSRAQQEGWIR